MPALISGFEYDIFISYRQNDNRSGWVREFVNQLHQELATTIKEPVSVYFDENPNDGLLETDHVGDSLKDKIKCLIFIPIISQTYTDQRSFAWKHEFLAFKKLAQQDQFGLKIKLASGNTTSRILPVRIHELDPGDKAIIDNEMDGACRSVDFIFKSPGVNRPLSSNEKHSQRNLNKTHYRDQVNKVANCAKGILDSLKRGTSPESVTHRPAIPIVSAPLRKKLALAGGIMLSLLILSYFVNGYLSRNYKPQDRSIAVLPFDDLSENHDQGYFSDGISEEIINALVKIQGLKVPGRTSSFQFKGKNIDLTEVGNKLNVAFILEGSVRKSGNNLRITAQLIDVSNGYHLWSETYDHELKDVFKAQDDITRDILKQLRNRLGIQGKVAQRKMPTESVEAYDLYLRGHQEFLLKGDHVVKAQEFLTQAVSLDPDFAMAHAALAEAYAVYDMGFGDRNKALASAYRALELDSTISSAYAVIGWTATCASLSSKVASADIIHSNFNRAIKLEPQNSTARLWYGIALYQFGLWRQSLDQLRETIQIEPLVPINYGILGWAEFLSGEDALGFRNLSEGIKMGWKAGNQRLACYYLEHQKWPQAEFYFKEHAKYFPLSPQMDFHILVTAIQNKDVDKLRTLLDSIKDPKRFVAGFESELYYLAGDFERAVAKSNDSEILTQLIRPGRTDVRKLPTFRTYVQENGLVGYWTKFGWPDVCHAVGESDFTCN